MAKGLSGLLVWRRSVELVKECYSISSTFPSAERFGITAQIRSAAVSIAANIAEGAGRDSAKEYLHFIAIARGSLREVQTYLTVSVDLGYAKEESVSQAVMLADEIGRMLEGLRRRYLATSRRPRASG